MRVRGVALVALVAAVGGCVDGAEPERAEHVIAVNGGQVEVRLATPEEVSPGEDRELWRYDAENLSPHERSVAVGIALDGLPEGCVIDDELWSEVSNDPDWPTFPQLNFDGGQQVIGPLANRQNISDECKGTFELVVRAAIVGSAEAETLRIPIRVA